MNDNKYMGVDGCRAGWFFVSIGPGSEAEFGVFENIAALYTAYSDATWILIDMPIGLPFQEIPTRNCDRQAREILSPKRHHSVFSPPCREALQVKSYAQACKINQNITARKISRQAFHVGEKIMEVDTLLEQNYKARRVIRESHPEICFWAMAGCKPMDHYKKTEEGLKERLCILKQQFPRTSAIYKAAQDRYLRKAVAKDDILDALALAVTAPMFDEFGVTIPDAPQNDSKGLPMEIVYAMPAASQTGCGMAKNAITTINELKQFDPEKCFNQSDADCLTSTRSHASAPFRLL